MASIAQIVPCFEIVRLLINKPLIHPNGFRWPPLGFQQVGVHTLQVGGRSVAFNRANLQRLFPPAQFRKGLGKVDAVVDGVAAIVQGALQIVCTFFGRPGLAADHACKLQYVRIPRQRFQRCFSLHERSLEIAFLIGRIGSAHPFL